MAKFLQSKEGAFALEQLKLLTAVYDQGLGCGLFTIDDVIHWSDKVIEALDNPPYEFIELSMMSSAKIDDIEGKLFDFYSDTDINIEYVVNLLLAVIGIKFRNNQIKIQESIRYVTRLLVHTDFYSRKEYYELYRCDDAYDLAVEGVYGDLKDIVKEFTNAICQYESYYSLFADLYKTVMTDEWEHE